MLEKKGIKKIGFRGKKGSTDRGYGQPAQSVEEPVDWLTLSGGGPVEDQSRMHQNFLSLLVAFSSRSRFDLGNGNMSSIKCSDG